MSSGETPNYWDYLKIRELLSLQGGLAGDESQLSSDEVHFIVVHQTFELWFKVILIELRRARDRLGRSFVPEEEIPGVVHHLDRVNEILELGAQQWRVMETLLPRDFLAFRDKLIPASGFQSFQMREIEILLGLPDEARRAYAGENPLLHIERLAEDSPDGSLVRTHLDAARGEATLKDVLDRWLHRTPIRGSGPDDEGDEAVVSGFLTDYLAAVELHHDTLGGRMAKTQGRDEATLRARFRKDAEETRSFFAATDRPEDDRPRARRTRAAIVFIESYRELPLLAWPRILLDRVVEMEEHLVLWRTRHARMVERTIGRRIGTGGSTGVDYLEETTKYRIFTDLWRVRTLLLPKDALPEIEEEDAYGFANG